MQTLDLPNGSAAHLSGLATASAQSLAAALGGNLDDRTSHVDVFFEGAARLVFNTGTPTGTVGVLFSSGGTCRMSKAEFGVARIIRASTASADVAIQAVQYSGEVRL